MDNENRIEELENRISSLEKLVDNLSEGNFNKITANKIIIKENTDEYNYDEAGLYIYTENDNLLYKNVINENGSIRSHYYNANSDEGINIGLCKHGAGRIYLSNIDGEDMIYIGSTNDDNNHSARINLRSQDQSGTIGLYTNNMIKDENVLTDIEIKQKDEDNDTKTMIFLGINKMQSDHHRAEIVIETTQNGQLSLWSKTSTDKF